MRKRSGLSVFLIPLLCIILAVWLVSVCMGGCKGRGAIARDKALNAAHATDTITYTKDARTGLCFAVVSNNLPNWYQFGVANVPCEKAKNFFTLVGRDAPR